MVGKAAREENGEDKKTHIFLPQLSVAEVYFCYYPTARKFSPLAVLGCSTIRYSAVNRFWAILQVLGLQNLLITTFSL